MPMTAASNDCPARTAMTNRSRLSACHALCALAAVMSLSSAALADSEKHAASVPLSPQYQQECAACHLAFPPSLLPAASWQRLLANLPRHYGVDASLDPATRQQLSTWLAANAGTGKRAREEPPQDRITQSAWFVRKHGEVPASSWKLSAVKSAAHCAACHIQAEQGIFDEHNVRIPR
jgi:hypothetical protein